MNNNDPIPVYMIAYTGYNSHGELSAVWQVAGTAESALNDYVDISMAENLLTISVLKHVVKSTDYDLTDKPVPTHGPFVVAVSHESDDYDDTNEVNDILFFLDTLPEAEKIYNEQLKKDTLCMANIFTNILSSNVFKNGMSVEESLKKASGKNVQTENKSKAVAPAF
jgi:hypothetical protein